MKFRKVMNAALKPEFQNKKRMPVLNLRLFFGGEKYT